MRLLAQRKDGTAGRTGQAPSGGQAASRPDTAGVGVLRETLDRSPGVAAQLRLQRTLQRADPDDDERTAALDTALVQRRPAGDGIVQRKILWNPAVDRTVFGGVETAPGYRRLDDGAARVYVTSAPGETAVTVVKSHNAEEIERLIGKGGVKASDLDYIVNIDPDTIGASGTKVEAERAFAPATGGGTVFFDPALLATQPPTDPLAWLYTSFPGLREIEEQRDPYARGIFSQRPRPQQPSLASLLSDPRTEPVFGTQRGFAAARAEGKLGLSTVLLHELGHIEQNLRTARLYKGPPRSDHELTDVPPLPPGLVERVAKAFEAGRLEDGVWSELLDLKNTADRWLSIAKDIFGEKTATAELAQLAQQTIELGDDLAPYVQVWLEYDVISNVEHPLAIARGEPIRHVHGVEQTIGSAEARRRFQEQKKLLGSEAKAEPGPGAAIFGELASTNAQAAPGDLRDVQKLMVRNAQKLTLPLVGLVTKYVSNYTTLKKAV